MKALVAFLSLLFALVSTAHAANGANDYLLSVSPKVQSATLGKAVGTNCTGQIAFYMGLGRSEISAGKGFWSIRCTDGRSSPFR